MTEAKISFENGLLTVVINKEDGDQESHSWAIGCLTFDNFEVNR